MKTEIIIDAPKNQVWNTLMEHAAYPEWNPFIVKLTGDPAPNSSIEITLQAGDRKPMTIRPTVLVNESENEFRWLGHMFIKGLFDGEHYFQLEEIGPNQTRLVHGENFSGMLSGMVLKMVGEDTEAGFTAMNAALKARVESAQ